MKGRGSQGKNILAISEEIIKNYNPITHSIDTHCLEKIGDVSKPVNNLYQVHHITITNLCSFDFFLGRGP